MEAHRRSQLGPRGLILGAGTAAREVDFFTAELHYWRLDPADWPRCLAATKRLGFEIVSTYVPWGVHETARGALDWSGPLDLPAFLDEVARAGLLAVLKPGPHINAELTHFGFPERVVRDPAMQARSARDTPVWMPAPPHMFPVPSYASRGFRDAAAAWLRGFAERIAPHRFPDGPVVAFQVDNETQMFFRLGAYDHDYHPDALAWWREHAGDLDAPRAWDPADAARCAEWVRFKEVYTARALGWVRDALDGAGLAELARYHNAPPSPPELVKLPAAARAIGGPTGLDFYHRARDYGDVRQRALYLGATGWPVPLACEVGVGGPPWLPPMTADDQVQVTGGVLAGGARGMCFFMVVDRDRWYGAPVSTAGEERPPAEWLAGLLRGLRAVGWTSLRRRCRAALVVSRAESRFAIASSLADPLSPVVTEILGRQLGPTGAAALARDPAPGLHRRWQAAAMAALDRAGVPYALLDEEAEEGAWAEHSIFIAPTLARVDRALWHRLRAAAERGAQVVMGPERPLRDELDRPLGDDARLPRHAGLMRAGSLDDLDGLARDLATAAGADTDWRLARPPDQPADQPLHLSVFEDPDGRVRAVALGNPEPRPARAHLHAPAGASLRDLVTDHPLRDLHAIELAAHAVRLFAVD
ncbi:MAG TPA: beta-galactosidase [Kofleriaceae bacterium]|nr:beta-galactosidase [Kofleriaceae bacterium]